MNKLLVILTVLALNLSSAQERFVIGLSTELADKNTHNNVYDYGFNLGARAELQLDNRFVYISARAFVFPELNDLTYFDYDLRAGLNYRDRWDENRIYLGGLIGNIKRDGYKYPKVGIEAGYDHYFNSFYIGFNANYQWKTDNKYWTNDPGHAVNSVSLEFGWHFN
jgi:hypothetical protein